MEDNIEIKREKIVNFVKDYKAWLYISILLLIIWYAASFRLGNLPLLKDVTTNDYITADPDAALYLRYADTIVREGSLPEIDNLRYYPKGLPTKEANPIVPYIIAYVYKIAAIFNKDVTVSLADVAIYPILFFILGMITFYLLVSKLFNKKVALVAAFILSVLPTYLFRTMTGVGDKEVFAMFLFYLVIWLYLLVIETASMKKAILLALLAGISTGIMNLAWNGATFLFMIFSIYTLINIFYDNFTRKDLYTYAAWLIPTTLVLMIFRYGLAGIIPIMFFSVTTASAYFALAVGIILQVLHLPGFSALREKINKKLPLGFASLIITFLFASILSTILISPTFIFDKIASIFSSLIHPFGLGRLTLTVAESYQPYFTDWIGQFSWTYLILFFLASIYLFYMVVKPLKGLNWKLTILYALFLLFFIPSRYSRGSQVFNGETTISNIFYIGSLIIFVLTFIALYLYGYYKKQEIFEELRKFNSKYLIVFIWLFLMIVGARGAIRLFFVLAPVTAVLSAYIIVEAFEKLFKLKDRVYKYSAIIVIAFLLLSPFPFYNGILIKFAKSSSSSAKFTGPGYNQQWQVAMDWVRKNTAEDAVFAHWWDYGYWVQTGSNRPTILDGGNHIAYWDTLMGRYVLTGQTEEQALEFLKTHDASYLLIDPTDVGKYPAYSSIGSDEKFDRLSYIQTFVLDPQLIQETRNETVYIYQGQFALDEDFIYNGKLYPKDSSGIVAFKLPVSNINNNIAIRQPTAFLAYQGQALEIPINCVSFESETYEFSSSGIKGCIKLLQTFSNNNVVNNNLGFPAAALYISERARRALWVQLYLLDKQSSNFKLVYSDHAELPLAIYQGQLIGPLRIWQISYPANIKANPQYLNTTGPEFL